MNPNTGPGMQQPQGRGGPAVKPGQMTMAMRAMPQVSGPKVLRIGKVQGGRVIEERVIKQRTRHDRLEPHEHVPRDRRRRAGEHASLRARR